MDKKPSYLWIIPATLAFPLLSVLSNQEFLNNLFLRRSYYRVSLLSQGTLRFSLFFVPAGLISSVVLIYLLRKTHEENRKQGAIIGFLCAVPFAELPLSLSVQYSPRLFIMMRRFSPYAETFLQKHLFIIGLVSILPLIIGIFTGYFYSKSHGKLEFNKKTSSLLLIYITLLFPLLQLSSKSGFFNAFSLFSYALVGLISGLILVYLLKKEKLDIIRLFIVIGFLCGIPFASAFSLRALFYSAYSGSLLLIPVITGIMGSIPLIIGTFIGYSVKFFYRKAT